METILYCVLAPLLAGLYTWSTFRSRQAWKRLLKNAEVRRVIEEKMGPHPEARLASWGTTLFALFVLWFLVIGCGISLVYFNFIQ